MAETPLVPAAPSVVKGAAAMIVAATVVGAATIVGSEDDVICEVCFKL